MTLLSEQLQQLKKAKQKRKKKAVDLDRLNPDLRESYAKIDEVGRQNIEGFGCKKLVEPLPDYLKADCEKVISGDNNTYIVFFRVFTTHLLTSSLMPSLLP